MSPIPPGSWDLLQVPVSLGQVLPEATSTFRPKPLPHKPPDWEVERLEPQVLAITPGAGAA